MNITPSPRILSMLGEIEIKEWQCIAELLDNSMDELMDWEKTVQASGGAIDPNDMCIEVSIPSSVADLDTSVIEFRDHGRGMSEETLEMAVKAGWSGNDLFDRLGLFGMGFNVATARLGRETEVWTTREGDPNWIGVRIDLDKIGADFEVPDLAEPKSDVADHGTRIVIKRLDKVRADNLIKRIDANKAQISHIYSWILDNTGISVRVNGSLLKAKRLCAWDESRSVEYKNGAASDTVPAVIQIDQSLSDADACMACGNWQSIGIGVCSKCGGTNLVTRERRIHGWVGIQRYLDSNKYGIDFIRNGRKILTHDKSVFKWTDMNNPMAMEESEYPVEIPADKGRIIGEIHIDYVPVDYKKDTFVQNSSEWRSVIRFLRGDAPLKPKVAQRYGLIQNNSTPIARLFSAYRRNDPGYRSLTPGDGMKASHTLAAEWGVKFERGDAEFQSDQKWWDAVVYHEQKAAQLNSVNANPTNGAEMGADTDAVIRALMGVQESADAEEELSGGINPSGSHTSAQNEVTKAPLTIEQHVNSLLKGAVSIPLLTRTVRANSISAQVNVEAWQIENSPLIEPVRSKSHAPLWLRAKEGSSAQLFIDTKHEAFGKQGANMLEMAIAEIAYFLLARNDKFENATIPQIMFEIRKDSFPDTFTDLATIQAAARNVISRIREMVQLEAIEDPGKAWGALSQADIENMEAQPRYVSSGKGVFEASTSDFVEFVPSMYFVKLFNFWPELFMDGRIFDKPYDTLNSLGAKEISKMSISSLLFDVAVASESRDVSTSMNELQRTQLSIEAVKRIMADQ